LEAFAGELPLVGVIGASSAFHGGHGSRWGGRLGRGDLPGDLWRGGEGVRV
jgi:hypothetical protein